jgi:hypothetical protein
MMISLSTPSNEVRHCSRFKLQKSEVERTKIKGVCTRASRKKSSEFFDASGRVTVPGLATRTLPKMLQSLEAAGCTPVTPQRFGCVLKSALDLRLLILVQAGFRQKLSRCNQ